MGSELSTPMLSWGAITVAFVLLVVGVALALGRRRTTPTRVEGVSAAVSTATEPAANVDAVRGRDRLTGLPVRTEFEAEADLVLGRGGGDRPFALLCIGLDGFRQVNETWSHACGDKLLREAAGRIAGAGQGTLGRIGGDEFVVLAPVDVEQARALAVRLLASLARPYRVGPAEVSVTASIGVALYPEHGALSRLLVNASVAMRSVKAVGGGAHAVYSPHMDMDHRDQALLRNDLRRAIERRQLELVYQPKVDARSLQITAAEALLRWNHPTRGVISPSVFIPIAERHGLIGAIGHWVIDEACRQAAAWRDHGLRMRVAVNLSSVQLRQDDLVPRIKDALARHGLRAERFTCEITESVAMEDTRATQEAFDGLREAGLHVSIDDFGTGYSSLAALRRLPAAELKIDRAFVADLENGADARSITQTIVNMAHTLDMRVVAEGVETPGQCELLVEMGCDELQGFLFARPMSAVALGLWATDDRPSGDCAFRESLFQETAPAPLLD